MTIATWLRRAIHWHPDREAYVDGDRRFTYRAFAGRAAQQVHALQRLGLQPGDRVAVLLNNGVEAVEAFAACVLGRYVHVPLNFRLAGRELGDLLRHSGARVLILDAEYAPRLAEIGDCPELQRRVQVVPGRAESDYERWIAVEPTDDPGLDVRDDDNLFITYTSGTTGAPKGVLFQHRQSMAHAPVPVIGYDVGPGSRILSVYPHNSIASLNMFYIPGWLVGGTVVFMDIRRFAAERWLELVEREKVTHCHLVPTMLFRILESPKLATAKLDSLVTVGYGSAPMPVERTERLMQVFGPILVQGYGMTEVSSIAALLSKKDHVEALAGDRSRLAACGRPMFGCELRVVDDAGRDVKPGELGEIIFRGPMLTSGYWRNPELTAQTIVDGWLHSGDLATLDAEGYLYMVDRKKDLIISGGANIASREVEEVLYWHPAVREAAVVARPDEEWGERVQAFVSLHEGRCVAPAELIAFCRERLAHFKCPDRLEILEELPKNAMGKLNKVELRAPLWAGRRRNVN